jgi:hypothetical protein
MRKKEESLFYAYTGHLGGAAVSLLIGSEEKRGFAVSAVVWSYTVFFDWRKVKATE